MVAVAAPPVRDALTVARPSVASTSTTTVGWREYLRLVGWLVSWRKMERSRLRSQE